MVFASEIFLFAFLPATLALYYGLGSRARMAVLLLASYLFYAWGAPAFVPWLVGTSLVDYRLALALGAQERPKARKLLLALSCAMNLGLLAYFKYAGFFVTSLFSLLHQLGLAQPQALTIALPVGISFFTFHKLSYVIDVYRGTAKPTDRLVRFALYIAFFPQLIAGPITRYHQIADQLIKRRHTVDKVFDGMVRLCVGLGKKVLIANVVGRVADQLLALPPGQLSWAASWTAALCYTFQIYFDFSGYSDMAIGLGKMFGFTFPENFNQPYVSRSITEFWRRWHMTLSGWFKDYLYLPLGGNRISPARTYVNLWIVFFLCGLWHGANWTFVLWGCYHGVLLVIERAFLRQRLERWPAVLTIPPTFLLIVVGWVLFRADTIAQALITLRTMFSPFAATSQGASPSPLMTSHVIVALVIAVALSFHAAFRDRLPHRIEGFLGRIGGAVPTRGLASLVLLILSWSSLATGSFSPFIYYQF